MARGFMPRKCKLKKAKDERVVIIDKSKRFNTTDRKRSFKSATLPPKQAIHALSNKSLEPYEQILIIDDKNVIRLRNTDHFVKTSIFPNLLPHYLVRKLNSYLLDTCTSAILYREQIAQLFRQRPPSKIVPKRIQLIGNNGTFKGASTKQNIIKGAEINVAKYGLFKLFVTIEQDKKRLLILMWQKDQNDCLKPKTGKNNVDEDKDADENIKFLCKFLSKTVYSLAKMYTVLNTQNSKESRPWVLSTNQNVSTNSLNVSTSKIVNGTLLDKICNFNDQFTISINFKDYRIGNALIPHKPKVSITMENKS